jgi:osmoprotectant transport system ATP-binding protein
MDESAGGDASAAVELRGVSLRRGAVLALDDVTLSLPLGETTAILGASGSGKSTLIQLAIGLLRPTQGAVHTLGQPIDYANPRRLRKRIGYAIQDVSLFPHLRIRQNILLPATLSGWGREKMEARLAELMTLMRLPPAVLDRYPHQLSGGQQQRAGLCRAMLLYPELLLLDEPFSGLDTMTRKSIHEQFLQMQQEEPVSTVLVTHDPQEAINLSQRLVILRGGRIQQYGPVRGVIEHPANEYVRELCTALESLPV